MFALKRAGKDVDMILGSQNELTQVHLSRNFRVRWPANYVSHDATNHLGQDSLEVVDPTSLPQAQFSGPCAPGGLRLAMLSPRLTHRMMYARERLEFQR